MLKNTSPVSHIKQKARIKNMVVIVFGCSVNQMISLGVVKGEGVLTRVLGVSKAEEAILHGVRGQQKPVPGIHGRE